MRSLGLVFRICAGTIGLFASSCGFEQVADPAALAQAASGVTGKQLALGKAHGCSLDAAIDGVRCWGDNRRGQTQVPLLAAATFIAAGGDTSCAISSGLVQCWGDGSQGQRDVPRGIGLSVQVAVGDAHVCAVSAAGKVACWGDDSSGQLRAPQLSNVESVGAGAHHSCALAAGKVVCWGDESRNQLKVPALSAPSSLVVAGDHACVIDAGKAVCWGGREKAVLEGSPELQGVRLLATGPTHVCAQDALGVHCWGEAIAGDLTPRELTGSVQLAVGGGDGFAHACARHLQGVGCWGADNFKQASYDGGSLHVLHRSESRIAADAERVWAIIMDLARYPEWNPYTIAMKSTLQIGAPMVMTVKMSAAVTLEQTEYIRVLEAGHKVCWGIETDTPELNSGERCQWLEPLPGGGTHYVSEDLIEGTANPLVTGLFGSDVQNGFDAIALALKQRAEAP
jgi:alpha-tubulin suppressor-like RCC1 family protein